MFDINLVFKFEEGIWSDVSDTKWDLTVPSRIASKDNISDTESQLLSTNMILALLDIPMVFALPSTKYFFWDCTSASFYWRRRWTT